MLLAVSFWEFLDLVLVVLWPTVAVTYFLWKVGRAETRKR